MSTFFITLPSSKNPYHSLLENMKIKVILDANAENSNLNEEEAENFMKLGEAAANESLLSLLKHIFSYKEKLIKDQKSFMSVLNIIALFISSHKNLDERDQLVALYLKNMTELPENLFSLKVRMLSALFNVFSVRDPKQYDLFKEILKLTDSYKKVSIILPTIENIDEYLRNWGYFNDVHKKREIYQLILNALYNNNKEKIAIDAFVKYLKTFEESQENELNNAEDGNFIISIIKRFLLSDSFHYEVFESIIHLKRVVHLEEKRLFEVLVLFITGNLHGYFKWLETHKEFLEKSLGIDAKKMEIKIRIKCLATFEETGKPISFKDMADKLHVNEEEVEDWVIMGIQNKIIEGKIDEFNKVIEIIDNSSKYLEKPDVEKLDKKLEVLIGVFEGYLENMKKKKLA